MDRGVRTLNYCSGRGTGGTGLAIRFSYYPDRNTRLAPYWGALYLYVYKYGSMRGWSLSPMSQSTRVSFTPPTVLCPGEIALSHAPGTVPGTMVRVKANLQISSDC